MKGLPQVKNLIEMLSLQGAERGDKLALNFLAENGDTEKTRTFAEFDQNAREIAAGLVAKGFAGRNLVMLYAPGIDYIEAFFGCLYAGAVPVPAYPPMGARDVERLKRIVMDCESAAILSNSLLMPMIEMWVSNESNGMKIECVATDRLLGAGEASGFQVHQAEPDDLAFLQYTSGSTGHPKGVMVSHDNLLSNFQQILSAFVQGDNHIDDMSDRLEGVFWLPPYHDMGLIGGVLTPVYLGSSVTLMSPLTFLKNPFLWLKTISAGKEVISGGPNFSYQYCVRKISDEQLSELDLSPWKVAFNGAEPIQVESLNNFANKFEAAGFDRRAFLPCYGMAEATLFVTGTPSGRGAKVIEASTDSLSKGRIEAANSAKDERPSSDLVSCGVLASQTEVRIVDPKTITECADGHVGEIWVRSPSVAKGYWNKPSFSESVFKAVIKGGESGQEYLRTGDLGAMVDGELYVTGRIKELIIVAGRNHYPQDIERSLQNANPGFRKGCGAAFAVTENGKEHLVIMQEVSGAAGDQADFQQLAAMGSRAVKTGHGITPKTIVLIDSGKLPKTSSGKIQRTEAKKLFENGNFAPKCVWESEEQVKPVSSPIHTEAQTDPQDWKDELQREIQQWVSDRLNVEPHHIDLDVTFSELGVDSVEAVELVDRLQDRIERTIPATELLRYPTVKALIEHFASELEAKQGMSDTKTKQETSEKTIV